METVTPLLESSSQNRPPPFHSAPPQEVDETIRRLQAEILLRERYQKELEESRKLALQATEYKSQFLANMSHEIRTPLSLILGFTEELIEFSQLNQDNKYLIATIRRNSEILARLIDDILDFTRIEAGKMEFDIHRLRCTDLLNDLKTNFETKCTESGILFQLEIQESLPEFFFSDEVRMKQILMNLVCNSLKYTDHGSVTLRVNYKSEPECLYFDVIDTGCGIGQDQQSKIFEVFKQAHKGKPGAGLGLALSKNLAKGLAGDLSLVHSEPGSGSWFRLEIKNQIENSSLVADTPLQRLSDKLSAPDLTGWSILVIDDLQDNLKLIEAVLRPTRARVESTTSAKDFLARVKGRSFQLLLVDLQMPELDGFEILTAVRQVGFAGPVWAISAHAMKTDQLHSRDAGFAEHITKPIVRADFYKKLYRLIT